VCVCVCVCVYPLSRKPSRAINFTNSYSWRKTSATHEYKKRFKRIKDSSLRTLNSQHIIVRQRKESLWIVGWQNDAALRPFPSPVITQFAKFHNALLMKWVEENTHTHTQIQSISHKILIPVAARSKARVCGPSLAGFAGSNSARSTYVCLLLVLCVVSYRSLRRADHSTRGFLPIVVWVWSRSLDREVDLGPLRAWTWKK